MSDRKVILPGDVKPGRRIFVPRGYSTEQEASIAEPTMVCRVPTGDGEVCGRVFFEGEERAWQKHVGECARAHRDVIHEESPRTRMPVFDEETWDPELADHMRKVGDRMIREGRLVVRPNERAGF